MAYKASKDRITEARLDKLRKASATQGGDHWLRDTDLPGFAARSQDGGTVSFYVATKYKGKRIQVCIGSHGETVTYKASPGHPDANLDVRLEPETAKLNADGARKVGGEWKAWIQAGVTDPQAEVRRQLEGPNTGPTFDDIWQRFVQERLQARAKPLTVDDYESAYRNHIKPVFGDRELAKIGKLELRDFIYRLAGKQDGDGNFPHLRLANKVRAYLSSFYTYAAELDVVSFNPVAYISQPQPDKGRDRVLTDAELKGVWDGADALSADRRDALRFLLLTGWRNSEVTGLRWNEVADDLSHVHIDPQRPGVKRPRAAQHIPDKRPLPEEAQAILRERQDQPGRRVFPIYGLQTPDRKAVAKAAGIADDWVFHDVRATFQTRLSWQGLGDEADYALGHVKLKGSRRSYDFDPRYNEKSRAVEAWQAYLKAARGENVVPLQRAE